MTEPSTIHRRRPEPASAERLIAAAFEDAPTGAALVSADGTCLAANRALRELLGGGDPAGAAVEALLHPDHRDGWREILRRLADGGDGRREADVRIAGPGGREVWVALAASTTADGAGPTRLICHFHDITARKRTEDGLREVERRFRDIAEATYDQIWETDEAHRFTFVFDPRNVPAYPEPARLAGRRRWEIEGFEPLERGGLERHLEDLLGRRPFRDFRFQMTDPDGHRHYWRSSGRPVLDARGRFRGYRGVSTNISGRTRAELALRQSEQRLRAVVDHSPTQIHIKDREGRYLLFNRQAASLFGTPEEAVLGRTSSEVLPGEAAEVLAADDREVIETSRTVEREASFRLGGRRYTFLMATFPIRGADGEVVAVGAIGTDITERKAAEDRIRESELKYRQLYGAANDAIFTFDEHGEILDVNASGERLMGMPAHEIIGTSYAALVPEDERHRIAPAFGQGVDLGAGAQGETRVRRRDGSLVPVEVSWSVSEIMGRRVIQGICRDITERRAAERAVKESQERARQHAAEIARILRVATVTEMAAAFAHQINQPINAVANYASVCLRQLEGCGWQRSDLKPILELTRDQAQRAGRLVRELGDFIRRAEPQIARHDVNEVVRAVVTLVEPELRRNRIRLDLELAAGLPPVLMEKVEVEQVVLNLLMNALEAILEGENRRGRVIVRTAGAGGAEIEVSVGDSGPGVAPRMRKGMFEPFATSKPNGLGMGLALCRSIVSRHGGRIWADDAPRSGAVFRFALPVNGVERR